MSSSLFSRPSVWHRHLCRWEIGCKPVPRVETSPDTNSNGSAAKIIRDSSNLRIKLRLGRRLRSERQKVLRQLFEQCPPARPRFVARFFIAFANRRIRRLAGAHEAVTGAFVN